MQIIARTGVKIDITDDGTGIRMRYRQGYDG